MGRYYYGDINGKFGFASQNSDDADNFGYVGHYDEDAYVCNHCGQSGSQDEFENEIGKECPDSEDGEHSLIDDEGYLEYYFTMDEIDSINEGLNETRQFIIEECNDDERLARRLCRLTSNEIDDWTTYNNLIKEYELNEHSLDTFICRFQLGMEILRCVLKTGRCAFYAEL